MCNTSLTNQQYFILLINTSALSQCRAAIADSHKQSLWHTKRDFLFWRICRTRFDSGLQSPPVPFHLNSDKLSYYVCKITLHILTAGYIKLGTYNLSLNRKRKRIKILSVIWTQLIEVYHNITSDNIIWIFRPTYSLLTFTYTEYRAYSLYIQNTASLWILGFFDVCLQYHRWKA